MEEINTYLLCIRAIFGRWDSSSKQVFPTWGIPPREE